MEELWQKSAAEIAGLVKSRQVSAVEITQSAFDRLQAVNGKLNAVVIETREDAQHSAELVDQAIERGEDPGDLAGVPVTVKVNIDQLCIGRNSCRNFAFGTEQQQNAAKWLFGRRNRRR